MATTSQGRGFSLLDVRVLTGAGRAPNFCIDGVATAYLEVRLPLALSQFPERLTRQGLPIPGTPHSRLTNMADDTFVPGYHLVPIRKGELGELSKIQEELDELSDGFAQGDRILMAVELADLYGAMELFIEKHLPGVTMADVARFSAITRRAFANGRR